LQIETSRFGKIDIDESKIIFFTSGILGFPEAKRYILLPHPNSPFFWLQAVDVPDLAFVIIDPKVFFPDYNPRIPPEAKKELHIKDDDEICILNIVTIPKDKPEEMTVNLLGPIIVNVSRKLAKQIVLDSRRYPLREPLYPKLKQPINPTEQELPLVKNV